jgi:hypothetical protein
MAVSKNLLIGGGILGAVLLLYTLFRRGKTDRTAVMDARAEKIKAKADAKRARTQRQNTRTTTITVNRDARRECRQGFLFIGARRRRECKKEYREQNTPLTTNRRTGTDYGSPVEVAQNPVFDLVDTGVQTLF